jgi:hypothetical protein
MSKAKPNPKKQLAAASEVTSQKDPNTGRFLPGNSGFGGRPKGARSKLTTEFFDDFYATERRLSKTWLRKALGTSSAPQRC